MAISNKPQQVGLSDPNLIRQTESKLAQSALIAKGKPTIIGDTAVLPSTTVSTTPTSVTTTTSANNQVADTTTVYQTNGTVYVSSIDQTVQNVVNKNIVNQIGVTQINEGNNITIVSSDGNGAGFVTINAVVPAVGNIAIINLDGNASNVLHGNGSWSADLTTYSNSNVVSLMAAFGSNTIVTTGNANVGNLGTAQVLATANITTPQVIANIATGTAPFVVTSTTQVANLSVATAGTAGSATTAGTVTTNAQSNITSVGTLTALAVTGNITAGNVTGANLMSATYLSGNGGNIAYQQKSTYWVDPSRTDTYTAIGTPIQPFKTITAAISAAVTAGYNDTNPAFIVLQANITENITLQPGIWLTSLGTGTHGAPVLSGTVTITSSTGTTVTNHYSLSNLRIVAPTNGNGILFTGTAPQKLFVRDVWIDANGTGTGIYMDNNGAGSTLHINIAHLAHSGTGDVYCINVVNGGCYVTDIETAGAVQVAAVQTGAVMTIDGSELDAIGDVVCETYGTGALTITNSIITNTQTNGNGIKINSAGSVVTVGNCLFSIPTGTGSVVWYNPAATLYGSTLAFAAITFLPGTNTTIDARVLPVPLTTSPGTIANPIFAGNITSTTTGTWNLTDNSSSSLSFDTTGKAGVLKFITTNAAEGVTMSGYANVTGNITGGNVTASGLTATGTITANGGAYGEVVTTAFASVWGTGGGPNPYSVMQVRSSDGVSGLGMQAFTGSGTLYGNTAINFGLATIRDKDVPSNLVIKAYIDSTGLNVTGIANISGNITGSNVSTAGIVKTGVFTTGTIPAAATAGAGARAFVTDADSVTFKAAYVGGSGNAVPVFSDGSAWYIG